jgi:hypothetical protein
VKCAVIAWSGTADSVTSDIISAWEAEGTNPTLIANATYENTPANLNVTTSWATYSVTANVDTASTANIIIFIWSDVTDTTAGDFLYITNAQLEIGTSATPFERRLYNQELANCQRYYYKAISNAVQLGAGWNSSTTAAITLTTFPVEMRIAPSAVEQTGTAANYRVLHGVTATACSAVPTFNRGATHSALTNFTVSSGLTAGQGSAGSAASAVTAFLAWSVEL